MSQNTLTLRVAADSWQGDPQFTVWVDGKQVGGTYTAFAARAQGAWQDVKVAGDFSATPGSVAVRFINDGYGGWGRDRNLFVGALTLGGRSFGPTGTTGAGNSVANATAALLSNGDATFDTSALRATAATGASTAAAAAPATPVAATGALTLRVAADAWQGDPQFTVTVDGKAVGGTYTATASHAAGAWQDVTVAGAFAANPGTVAVNFVNDGYGGYGKDRNLYVAGVTVGGRTLSAAGVTGGGNAVTNTVASLLSNGTATFKGAAAGGSTAPAAPTPVASTPVVSSPVATAPVASAPVPSNPVASAPVTPPSAGSVATNPAPAATCGSLTLRVAADAWQGDPQFTVTVDGKAVGGTYTATASHAAGAWQDVTVAGAFAANPGTVAVNFVNDGYGGYGKDRNLYVAGVTVGGRTLSAAGVTGGGNAVTNTVASLLSNGTATFNVGAVASAPAPTPAPADKGLALLGVNLAGGEFGADKTPGTYGTDYIYPTHTEIDYYAAKGMNVIRVPFLWERLQTALNGPLNQTDLSRLQDVVKYATDKGLHVVLDPHDYGSGFGQDIGTGSTTVSAFADFWSRLATAFKGNPNVMFGLMNEPHNQGAADWLGAVNAAVSAIRATGASQEILVPGTHWDGAWTWTSSDNASVIGTGVRDPLNNYAFEVHQYLDIDGSGTRSGVSSDTLGVERLTDVTNWAEANHAKLFLGEFGVSQDQGSLSALDKMLTYMGQHGDAWQGGTYWAGGPWWWGSNIYGVEPDGLGTSSVRDQPQMALLTGHVAA